MKRKRGYLFLSVMILLLASCAGQATPAPGLGPISVTDIYEISWQWTEFVETGPASQSPVPDPMSYTLLFMPRGPLYVKADCNAGSGTYRLEGNRLTLELEAPTQDRCAVGSESDKFLGLLADVETAAMDGARLILYLRGDAGHMVFDYGGPAGVPAPEPSLLSTATPGSMGITLDTELLPHGWQVDLVPATTYDETQPPGPTGLPEHIQISFGADPENRQPGDPVIHVIPVEAYTQQWEAAGNPAVSLALEHLDAILAEKPSPVPPFGMPVLPFEEVAGFNDLAVQGSYLDLDAASGVRFVGRFAQDANPVTNAGLRYIFQGFSKDGDYLVTFFYPVTTSALPSPENLPAGEQERVASNFEAHLRETTEMLNTLGEEQWEPDLSILDSVLGSLTLGNVDAGE